MTTAPRTLTRTEADAARLADHPTLAGNCATVAKWVEEASAGLLTASHTTVLGADRFSIGFADGRPFSPRCKALKPFASLVADRPTTGVIVDVYAPVYRKLDRRFRQSMRQVRDAVRMALVDYADVDEDDVQPDPDVMAAYGALSRFERMAGLS